MIDLNKYRKSAFLKAADLTATQTRVRIQSVGEQEIGTPAERKVVLQFTSPTVKPLVCGVEKLEALIAGLGCDETRWLGAVILLVKTRRPFNGKIVDSIMIEVPPQPRASAEPESSPPPPSPSPARGDRPSMPEAQRLSSRTISPAAKSPAEVANDPAYGGANPANAIAGGLAGRFAPEPLRLAGPDLGRCLSPCAVTLGDRRCSTRTRR